MRAVKITTTEANDLPKIPHQIKIVDVETGIEIVPMSCNIQIRRDEFVTAIIEIPVAEIDLIALVTKWKLEEKA